MFKTLSSLAIVLSACLAGLVPASVVAANAAESETVAVADAQAAKTIVQAQLAAFAADDADQAFSYASASIRQMFGTAAQFIRMVRGSYPVVYRPAAVVFLKPELADDELVQPVHMTDQAGSTWLALYRLQRQEDRSWRIGGCVLLPRAGKTV